ncbi:MAG: hutU [Blastococcus sp.]|nr:hutU [Blastococcus sp.]
MTSAPVEIPRLHTGPEVRCKGWRQEALLRMLENTLTNGEHPEKLVVYAGTAKAARNPESLHRTIQLLRDLEEDETLVIQSGKPVGVFRSGRGAPLILMATSNLVGRWATSEHFEELERRGLTMFGGYTAGDWQYIGSQGIVQGTYQTFVEVARKHFDSNDLAGRLVVTAGLGGMGGAQPLGVVIAGGVAICADVDPSRIEKRIQTGYLMRSTTSLDEALAWAEEAVAAREALSIGLLGNAAELLPEMVRRGVVPDVVTDQTSAHDALNGYIPIGYDIEKVQEARRTSPDEVRAESRAAMVEHVKAMLAWREAGAVVFEYGNNIREQARLGGVAEAPSIPGFMPEYIRPLFCRGIGPFRWIATSGDPEDIAVLDQIVVDQFPDSLAAHWVPLAQKYVQFQGLPARIGWLGHGERARFALLVNAAVADGRLRGPIAFTRDHLDTGSVAQPLRETEGMPDGSDAVSDWPLLNALLNSGAGADLVAIHAGGSGYAGYFQSAGVTVIADGSSEANDRLSAVLSGDTGIGVVRHADAGYQSSLDTLREVGDVKGYIEK